MEEILLGLLAVAWALGTPIVAIVALVRTSRLREANERLVAEVALLRRQGLPGDLQGGEALPPPFVAPSVAEPVIEPPPLPVEPVAEVEAPAPEPVLPPPLVVEPVHGGWEQRLGARAFVWVGAITLALAAIFLVRYSIEEGYLSPEVRVILAALFGFALVGGAEKMKSRDDWVAQALAAAGIAALYGSLFSAVALYGMISKVAAGGGAAALTAFAIGVSLRHGIFVAGLAFVGGFASPAIIGSETPNTPVLFGYLLAIAAGTLGVIRIRGWWPLGWGVLAGSALWTVVWMLASRDADELHWVGLFLVAVAGLFVWATWRRMEESENPPNDVVALVWTALAGTGVLLVCLVVDDNGEQKAGWLALALHGAGAFALGRWTPRFQYAAALGPGLSLLALALWWGATRGAGAGWDADRFAWLTILFGGFYAAAAFSLLWNAGRPGFWAALSVAAAFTHFLLCWYVLRSTVTGVPWGLISVGLAAPFLVGAERLARWRDSMTGATEALGYLAAGVTFFIAAAIPMEFSREWITVAYAIELAAVAAIAARLDLRAMRLLCWPLLAVVVVRFVLNPEVLKYPLGVTPVLNWILWGYGISIAALVVSLRFLRPTGDVRLVRAVEATIALLAFVLVTLEVRSLFQPGAMATPAAGFMERSFYVAIWGAFALAALWMARRRQDPVALWAWRLSGGLAVATALGVQVLIANPVFEPANVGRLPLANGLFLAYAVPAAMAALARRWIDVEPNRGIDLFIEAAASVLAFVYVSLEVRHLFDPGFERDGFAAYGLELYAYSIVWLLFGTALLALGFLRHTAAFRHAGMVLVCIVVAKVFLIDMAGLQGLLRVFSFLGLGAALIGLGYAYRRFGFKQ
ncbi:MAG: DUF2339 domain-containing protein [Reyranella sp.]|uniref:DUF2339 domain-containing protein n=1 Tax=Reyranella sp. TaxID=1929291 RepID=UPI001227D3A6|nr:DUF2339 domain-containing protein [Reyranella sp.]TAJ41774.1 MAG: DUF2339 domain-containing protein [Reyranella sp.]